MQTRHYFAANLPVHGSQPGYGPSVRPIAGTSTAPRARVIINNRIVFIRVFLFYWIYFQCPYNIRSCPEDIGVLEIYRNSATMSELTFRAVDVNGPGFVRPFEQSLR